MFSFFVRSFNNIWLCYPFFHFAGWLRVAFGFFKVISGSIIVEINLVSALIQFYNSNTCHIFKTKLQICVSLFADNEEYVVLLMQFNEFYNDVLGENLDFWKQNRTGHFRYHSLRSWNIKLDLNNYPKHICLLCAVPPPKLW